MNYIINHSTLLTSLVSFWEMQEASGTRYDAHGTNHLTASGTGGVGQAAGKVGWGADFESGDSDRLTVADNGTLPLSGSGHDISAFMWIKFETATHEGGWSSLIQHYKQSGNNRSWAFYNGGSGTNLAIELSTNGSASTSSATVSWTPSTATWYHVGFTYDVSAGEVKFYVDGSQQGATQTGLDTSYFNSTDNLRLGNFYDDTTASGRFDGVMDQVGLWTKVLTSGEITDLYNGGDGMGYGIAFSETIDSTPLAASTSQNYTVVNNYGNAIFVSVIYQAAAGNPITSITYGGVSLSQQADALRDTTRHTIVWFATGVPIGSNTLNISSGSSVAYDGITSTFYMGVATSSAIDAVNTDVTGTFPKTINATSDAAYNWVYAACGDSAGGAYSGNTTSGTGAGVGIMRRSSIQPMVGDSNGVIGSGAYSGTVSSSAGNTLPRFILITFRAQTAAGSSFTPRVLYVI